MDKLMALRHYSRAYKAAATQLKTYRLAREWMEAMPDFRSATVAELDAHAKQSAAWASRGFYPHEAAPLIASGMAPELASAADPTTPEQMGEYLAAQLALLNADHPE